MKQLAFGDKRTANARADVESRLARLENVVQQFPSRIGSGQQQARRFRVTKTAHGWIKGTWILAAVNTGGSLTWSTATTADQNFDRLAIVTHVVDADHVMAACGPGLLDASWLNTSDTLFGTVKYLGTAGGYASTHQPFARPTHANLNDGWVWLYGPGFYSAIEYTNLQYLNDTNINGTGNLLTDGQPLVWNSSQSRWINGAVGAAGLPSIAGLSVLGRAANSTGTVAAITGSTTGQVLQVGATTLQWAQLATASYGDGSVTAVKLATDVVLGSLHDTSVASPSDLDFLRWSAGTSKWTKTSLGDINYAVAGGAGVPALALDGGSAAGQATLVGLGHTASRFILAAPATTVGLPFDITLTGDAYAGGETCARIKMGGSGAQVSFYDQASGASDGDEVIRWNCSATPANRSLEMHMPLTLSSTYIDLKANNVWANTNSSGSNAKLTGTSTSWTLSAGGAGAGTVTLSVNNGSSSLALSASAAYTVTIQGGLYASGDARLANSTGKLGFFDSIGVVQQAVTGSKAGNAALASLLTALASMNLVVNNST